jgi:hypothetical protein
MCLPRNCTAGTAQSHGPLGNGSKSSLTLAQEQPGAGAATACHPSTWPASQGPYRTATPADCLRPGHALAPA